MAALKTMPVGRWKGTPLSEIPDHAVVGLAKFWAKSSTESSHPQAGLIASALSNEWVKRGLGQKKKPRKRK